MNRQVIDEKVIWEALAKISDPEIPVLSLVEMKIIREVRLDEGDLTVVMSPTFVGCPALDHMKNEIRSRMKDIGIERVRIETTFTPPWSTDMMDEEVKEKLRLFGIAPPPRNEADLATTLARPVCCPFCNSENTRLTSSFGPTLCKQIYFCDNCKQPFERFKPV